MGGLMGGLLAGGLIAALMGGAFEGLQMMDMLIFGILAFVAFKLFKGMNRVKAGAQASPQAFAGSGGDGGGIPNFKFQTPGNTELSGSTTDLSTETTAPSDVPHHLPDGFDQDSFIKGSLDHYRTLQDAWNVGNFSVIQEYVSEQIYQNLVDERATLAGDQHTEVLFLDAQIVRANTSGKTAELSLQFSGRYRDSKDDIEEDITDVWHLEKDLNHAHSPWLIVGMQ